MFDTSNKDLVSQTVTQLKKNFMSKRNCLNLLLRLSQIEKDVAQLTEHTKKPLSKLELEVIIEIYFQLISKARK